MTVTSLKCIRKRAFQLFSICHFIGVPLFLIIIIIHGSDSWFNWGFPLGLLAVPATAILASIHYGILIYDTFFKKFYILDISITDDKGFVMMYIKKPKGWKHKPGQYVFMNCPDVSRYQWHPFSIASSPENPNLIFMIKRNGDWTGKFIDKLYESKKTLLKVDKLSIEGFDENAIFRVLSDIEHNELENKIFDKRKIYYPILHLSRAVTAAAESAIYRRNVILIGAGSGISPYLSFIEQLVFFDSAKQTKDSFGKAHVVFVI